MRAASASLRVPLPPHRVPSLAGERHSSFALSVYQGAAVPPAAHRSRAHAHTAAQPARTLFNRKQWSKDGKTILAFVEQHAFLSHSHVFASYMDNVLLPSGKLNPTETFFRGTDQGGRLINGGQVTVGLVGQEILSLLHAYQVTHDETLLDKVQELLAPFRAQPNALGLWDTHHLGYYAALTFPGRPLRIQAHRFSPRKRNKVDSNCSCWRSSRWRIRSQLVSIQPWSWRRSR